MDASGINLWAGLLQVREGINCRYDEVPDNVILCPTAFASRTFSSAEQQHSKIKQEAFCILHGLENVSTTVWTRRYIY